MSIVALGSFRSAATTTTALGLARTWPEGRAALLGELDPSGGTLAATLGLRPEPGLQSLAADARRGLAASALFAHTQLFGEVPVLVAPPAAEQMRAAFAMLGDLPAVFDGAALPASAVGPSGAIDAASAPAPVDVICDCGRLDLASPVLSLFAAASCALLVVRGELADLHVLAASLERRGIGPDRLGARLGLVLATGTYGPAEVEEAIGAPVLATLPHDPAGARTLVSEATRGLAWRSPLPRALRSLAEQVIAGLAASDADGAEPAERTDASAHAERGVSTAVEAAR